MKSAKKQELIKEYGSDAVVKALAPYVTENRKARIETVINGRLKGVQLALEAPSDINNALAAVRSSEALGVSTVHMICPEGDARYSRGITQGAIYWVEVIIHESLNDFLNFIQVNQVQLVGGTVDATVPLQEVPVDQPLCIFLGNEQRGLTAQAQAACAVKYKIPMYGMTESFNLSVSAAISLYNTTSRVRDSLGNSSDLLPVEQQNLRANYFLNSLAPRLSTALLGQINKLNS